MTQKLPKPSAILFDWDNTLVDTWPVIHFALNTTFQKLGKPEWSMAEVRENVHRSMKDSFPVLFGDDWSVAAAIYQKTFRDNHLQRLTPLPQALETIELIAELGIPMAVVSNKLGENLRKEVNFLQWEHFFFKIVGASDADNDKPHADPVHLALQNSNITLDEHIWFVGDSVTDMECAHNCGVTPIFFGDDDLTSPRYENLQPKIHVKDHKEAIALLYSYMDGAKCGCTNAQQ